MLSKPAMEEIGRGAKVFDAAPVRGRLAILRGPDDVLGLMDRDEGAVGVVALVKEAGATFLTPIYHELTAIVCTGGTPRSHIGIMSREYQLPCVMATKWNDATGEPLDGHEIEVDCSDEMGVVRG